MSNFYKDNEDLRFYVEKYIDWKAIVEVLERNAEDPAAWQQTVETYKEVLSTAGEVAATEIAPRARQIDAEGMHLQNGVVVAPKVHTELFDTLRDMGMYGLCAPQELGGMNCPGVLYFLMGEVFGRADVSVLVHYGFHVASAYWLLHFSIHEGSTEFDADGRIVKTRFQKPIEDILAGKTWGSMDLTEPNAGSDLAALRTRAIKQEDGTWRLTGNKIFITSGHGNYHFVLAKTEDKNSLTALSLFLVPLKIERNGETVTNAYVDRIEEKCGHHGSATCSVQFDNSEAELIGKEGEGFKLMLKLMNHARLGVGFESIGLAQAAYCLARDYAKERRSMGKPIDQHPMVADYLDEMDVTIRAIRAIAVEAAVAEELATGLELEESRRKQRGAVMDADTHRRIKRLRRRARFITPLLKYAASEQAVYMARMSMQLHGGNGYMKDCDAERLLRDSLVLPVYEGTSQIQALMALKDNISWITKKPLLFLRKMALAKLNAARAEDEIERAVYRMQYMACSAQRAIVQRVAKDKWSEATNGPLAQVFDRFFKDWDPKRDFAHGQLHAERLTRILVDVAAAEALLDQAKSFPERRELAARWVEKAEPRVRYNLDLIENTGNALLNRLEIAADDELTAKSA
jgi:alkylation response protein AidB-like acyl-CoA dehydrogenase